MNRLSRLATSRVLCLLSVALFAATTHGAPSDLAKIQAEFRSADGRTVLVAAHRGLMGLSTGCWDRYPENSLSGIAHAIELGVDIVELDVRTTKDGHLVLMHDGSVDRTTDGKGSVASLTLQEIKKLHLRRHTVRGARSLGPVSAETVPTLEEAMVLCKGKCLVNLDKAWDIIPECHRILKKTDTVEQAIFKGYHDGERSWRNRVGLQPPVVFMLMFDFSSLDWVKEERQGWELIKPFCDTVHPAAVELCFKTDDNPIVSSDVVRMIRESGARAWANSMWNSLCGGHTDASSLSDPAQGWGWMIDRGINIVQTDEGEKLLKYLQTRGLHW